MSKCYHENLMRHEYGGEIWWQCDEGCDFLFRHDGKRIELAEAALKLCEWVPDCSKGSSGYIRKERVKKLAQDALK